MAKLPHPPARQAASSTQKRSIPTELREPNVPTYVTTKLRKVEIDALLVKEREKSGMRPAVSDEAIQRFERRELRATIPAPPEVPESEVESTDADKSN